ENGWMGVGLNRVIDLGVGQRTCVGPVSFTHDVKVKHKTRAFKALTSQKSINAIGNHRVDPTPRATDDFFLHEDFERNSCDLRRANELTIHWQTWLMNS